MVLLGSFGIERAAGAEPFTPVQIQGSWATRCDADLPPSIEFDPTGAEVASSSGMLACRLVNDRALSEVRWYLDLECDDGSLLQLDVYLVARGALLVTMRPLGEACRYRRR